MSPSFHLQDMPTIRFGYKIKPAWKEYNHQNKKETEDMLSKKSENFFWNLFLETGRIDAYLLLKEEESENDKETKESFPQ